MSTLCQVLGAARARALTSPVASSAVRAPSAPRAIATSRRHLRSSSLASRGGVDVGSASAYGAGFPPIPAPGVSVGSARGSSATTSAYDAQPPTDLGGGFGPSTPPPPVVEWDARSANTVTLIGNAGMDPEIVTFESGNCVARVNIAVRGKKPMADDGFGGPGMGGGGDDESDTHWLEVEAWNDAGRQLADHVTKGRQIRVTGRIKTNTWVDKATGQNRSKVKISANEFAFVSPYDPSRQGGRTSSDPYASASPQPPPASYANNAAPAAGMGGGYAASASAPGPASASAGGGGGGGGGAKDDQWRDLIENPNNWWDNRPQKLEPGANPRRPDFKHKDDGTPLWIDSYDTPQWAADKLLGNSGVGAAVGAAAGAAMAGGGGDGFDPYYADPPAGGDVYSQPYDANQGGYEPARQFADDDPPF